MPIPQPHNLTAIGNASGILDLTQKVNDNLMYGWLGTSMVVSVFSIAFIISLGITKEAGKSFIVASWISFLSAILLRVIDLVPDVVMWTSLAMAALSIAIVGGQR